QLTIHPPRPSQYSHAPVVVLSGVAVNRVHLVLEIPVLPGRDPGGPATLRGLGGHDVLRSGGSGQAQSPGRRRTWRSLVRNRSGVARSPTRPAAARTMVHASGRRISYITLWIPANRRATRAAPSASPVASSNFANGA